MDANEVFCPFNWVTKKIIEKQYGGRAFPYYINNNKHAMLLEIIILPDYKNNNKTI